MGKINMRKIMKRWRKVKDKTLIDILERTEKHRLKELDRLCRIK